MRAGAINGGAVGTRGIGRRERVNRRAFVAGLGGLTLARATAAQSSGRRRVGILMSTEKNDPSETASVAAFIDGLKTLGWDETRNVEFVTRWGGGNSGRMDRNAREMVALAPDAILVKGANVPAARRATATIPLVFVVLSDVIAQAEAGSFARPKGNLTGFASSEFALVGKRLELLREMSPRITRALYIRSKETGTATRELFERVVKDAATTGFPIVDGAADNAGEIETEIQSFGRTQDGGLIIAFDAFTTVHQKAITALAAGTHLPAIYPLRAFIESGGLCSYGFDQKDQFRSAASYIDRLLKGAKPGDLPVQLPTKFQFLINLKAAKALGLAVPATLLARADEVIE
jgi:putative ABC transport system substrate-binding protein